jgi:hypothetical protein
MAKLDPFWFKNYGVVLKHPALVYVSSAQDGGQKSREHNFEIWQHFCIQSFAMNLCFELIFSQLSQKW